jgi:hypothetical protein
VLTPILAWGGHSVKAIAQRSWWIGNERSLALALLLLNVFARPEEDASLRTKRKRAGWDDSFIADLVDF